MKYFKKIILPIFVAGFWISISEFLRNEFLLKSRWIRHYESLGIEFPSDSINGGIWGIWSFTFATCIFLISSRFNLIQTTIISWIIGFVMMWLVIGNLGVLPFNILPLAIPLSIFEAFLASYLVKKLS